MNPMGFYFVILIAELCGVLTCVLYNQPNGYFNIPLIVAPYAMMYFNIYFETKKAKA